MHLVSLPHTQTTRDYEWCAYTAKARKFCDMMTPRGHQITLYAGPQNDALCHEHVPCTDDLPPNGHIPRFAADDPMFARFNEQAIEALRERVQPHDWILLSGGLAQQPIADAFPGQTIEYGIGYGGVIPSCHHIFESYAWMHTVLGSQTGGDAHQANGRFYDAVVPNFFDPADFPAGDGEGGYLLFVGRLIERKGVQVAIEVAQQTGLPLKVAGAGDFPLPDWVDYRGVVGPVERAELMGGAVALLAPTTYVEPFGGVAVEAQMCGTPAITTDWGAFPETVLAPYRCRTLAEFVRAVERARYADRTAIRQRALNTWALEAVAPLYERVLDRLDTLHGAGWYALPA